MDLEQALEIFLDGPYFQCYNCRVIQTSKITLKRCSGCQLVTYCSKACQEDNWKGHKIICKKFPVVNGKNVYYTTEPWEKHIACLLEQAAQLPKPFSSHVEQIFSQPKVCKTCHEPRLDRLKVCDCNIVCYCSKECAKKDIAHRKSCKNLHCMMGETLYDNMRQSYPISFWGFLQALMESGFKFSSRCGIMDLGVVAIHIVINTPYYDAVSWGYLFDKLPNMNILDITIILQDVPIDESKNCYRRTIPHPEYKTNNKYIVYSIYQKPYHMYFSSDDYNEADFVITYGISDPKYDANNKISYKNMTNYSNSVLCLMDSTKELVTKAVKDVRAVQPSSVVLLSPQRNRGRGFGGILTIDSENYFDADVPNVKSFMAGLHRPSGEKCEPFFLEHFKDMFSDPDSVREMLMKHNGVPEGHL